MAKRNSERIPAVKDRRKGSDFIKEENDISAQTNPGVKFKVNLHLKDFERGRIG